MLHFLCIASGQNSQGQGTHGRLKNVIQDYMGIVMGICSPLPLGIVMGICSPLPLKHIVEGLGARALGFRAQGLGYITLNRISPKV